jgi:site-specific DNA-methyltransferase (adenine-specific)
MKPSAIHLEWEGKNRQPARPAARLTRLREVYPAGRSDASPASLRPPRNRLILGDNLAVMDCLRSELKGAFRLIYADPPFATGKGFPRRIGRREDSRKPGTWKLGEGYSDSWETIEQYLSMLYPRLAGMHDLLADNGTLYLHLDWHVVHYARLLLDEIFGPENFVNEVIWIYHGPSPVRSYFNRKHDTILVYGKGRKPLFFGDRVRIPYHPSTQRTFQSSPRAGFGKKPDLGRGKIPEDWWYFPVVARLHSERTGYPTQKPEALLERIILASSDRGDLIGDFFCGSGTTVRVADSLSRRWIGCDILPHSIALCQKRLAIAKAGPYAVETANPPPVRRRAPVELQTRVVKKGRRVEITLSAMKPCRPDGFPASLDYWEVDFQYDGKCMRSTFQSARPWRDGGMQTAAAHTYSRAGQHRIYIRCLSVNGETAEKQMRVAIP